MSTNGSVGHAVPEVEPTMLHRLYDDRYNSLRAGQRVAGVELWETPKPFLTREAIVLNLLVWGFIFGMGVVL